MRKIKEAFTKKVLTAIIVIGVLAIVLLYSFVYLKYSDMTIALEDSNRQLRNTIAELKGYYDNQKQYEADIELSEEIVNQLIEDYPADARPEDVIMLAVEMQENSTISYTNINMGENELVYDIPAETVSVAGIEGLEQKISFMKKKATYVNKTNYENLKSCIEQIYDSPNRIGIESISYAKEENSDVLSGTMDLIFYYATGTGKEYVCPDIAEYLMGTDNIFQ